MTFTASQLLALLPLLLTTGAMVALMLAIAWKRCDDTAFVVTIAGLNLALFSLPIVMAQGDQGVTPLLQIDATPSSTWGWCSSAPWPPVPSAAPGSRAIRTTGKSSTCCC